MHRLQFIKKRPHQRFFLVKLIKFFRTVLSRTTFGGCFCFGGWPCSALLVQNVFDLAHSLNKQPSEVIRAIY